MRSEQCRIAVEILESSATQNGELGSPAGPGSASKLGGLSSNVRQFSRDTSVRVSLLGKPIDLRPDASGNITVRVCLEQSLKPRWEWLALGAGRSGDAEHVHDLGRLLFDEARCLSGSGT